MNQRHCSRIKIKDPTYGPYNQSLIAHIRFGKRQPVKGKSVFLAQAAMHNASN
jgi:hypothetical protein